MSTFRYYFDRDGHLQTLCLFLTLLLVKSKPTHFRFPYPNPSKLHNYHRSSHFRLQCQKTTPLKVKPTIQIQIYLNLNKNELKFSNTGSKLRHLAASPRLSSRSRGRRSRPTTWRRWENWREEQRRGRRAGTGCSGDVKDRRGRTHPPPRTGSLRASSRTHPAPSPAFLCSAWSHPRPAWSSFWARMPAGRPEWKKVGWSSDLLPPPIDLWRPSPEGCFRRDPCSLCRRISRIRSGISLWTLISISDVRVRSKEKRWELWGGRGTYRRGKCRRRLEMQVLVRKGEAWESEGSCVPLWTC